MEPIGGPASVLSGAKLIKISTSFWLRHRPM
jgi:SAM-dependent methyltransferase